MVVSCIRLLLGTAVAFFLLTFVCWAGDDEVCISDQDEAFRMLRKTYRRGESATTVEDAIAQFFEKGEVDEGTYPATDIWERGFDLRRDPPTPLRLGYSGRVFLRHSDDNISEIEKWEKELELLLDYGDWDSYLRFSDYNVFAYQNDPVRFEKGRLRYNGDGFDVTLGSFGAVFGRGLALSMFEDRTLNFDNELEGTMLEADIGDAEVTALWGTHKALTDPRHSEVAAARVEIPLGRDFTFGAHYAQVEFPDPLYSEETPTLLNYDIYGATAELNIDRFGIYAETARIERAEEEFAESIWDHDGERGHAHYLNVNFAGEGIGLACEFKDYYAAGHPFAVVPPLRSYEEQAAGDPNDDKGYGAELTVSPFNDGSFFTFNYGQGNSHNRESPYTEFAAIYTSPVTRNTTWVAEYWKVHVHEERHEYERITLNHQFNDKWTGGAFFEREHYQLADIFDYHDYIIEAELAYEGMLTAVYTREMTGANLEEDSWEIWELKWRPDSRQEINVIWGTRREGFVCSGGVCRLEPAFDGFRADYLIRF